jgi:hypothetical protein
MTWWYNTESGALTSAGTVQSFLQSLQAGVGLGVGWHELSVSSSATEAQAAAAAKAAFPTGATPTTSVATQEEQAVAQEATGNPEAFSSVQNALSGFYTVITNGKMWRSLGWLLLGVVMIVTGLGLWLKGDIPIGSITSALASEGGA